MRYGEVCTGIDAPGEAWKHLGWSAQWFSEIEPFPNRVLAHHQPGVPNLGDMTKLNGNETYEQSIIDLLVGGTPCQSFSIAGLRAGMADPRGNLALTFLSIVDRKRPRWMVWENVPGVLSSVSHDAPDPCPPPAPLDMELDGQEVDTEDHYDSEELHALNTFLAGLSELGYGWAMRVLDAQYFGVPQRRRRVFVVGYSGDVGGCEGEGNVEQRLQRMAAISAAVLFERESLSGNPPPGAKAGAQVAALTSTGVGASGADDNQAQAGHLVPTLKADYGKGYGDGEIGGGLIVMAHGQGGAEVVSDGSPSLTCNHEAPILAFYPTNRQPEFGIYENVSPPVKIGSGGTAGNPPAICFMAGQGSKAGSIAAGPISPTLKAAASGTNMVPSVFAPEIAETLSVGANQTTGFNGEVVFTGAIRRLTPLECERLQGFPDNHTAIPGAADGPRYKAIGNSMAVPVMRWIGERIKQVDEIIKNA